MSHLRHQIDPTRLLALLAATASCVAAAAVCLWHGVADVRLTPDCLWWQVREQLEMLQVGCKEVRASQGLIHLLQAVLGAGNHLNQGTFKGNAGGVHLPFLQLTLYIQSLHCCNTLQLVWQPIL